MAKALRVLALAAVVATMLMVPVVANAQTGRAVTIPLSAANSGGDRASGVNGSAVLTDLGGGRTRVDIRVTVGPGGSASMPNHIHTGRCPDVGAVTYPLNAVTSGVGQTEVNASLTDLLAGTFAINLHRSATESGVYVSCGNVVAGASALPATGSPITAAVPLIASATLALAGFALRRRG